MMVSKPCDTKHTLLKIHHHVSELKMYPPVKFPLNIKIYI